MDANILSRNLKNYLSQGVEKVSISPGQSTLMFIEKWRLHQIFSPEIYESSQLDYRYNILLAYINANRSKEYIELLANENKYHPSGNRIEFPEPYKGFQDDLEYHINSVLVSHKKVNKLISSRKHRTRNGDRHYENFCLSVRGSLHK